MELKDGIYLRRFSPCKVELKKKFAIIKYTKWNDIKQIWEFVMKEKIEKRIFEILNKEPARVLFFYSEKWYYGELKTGLIDGKDIPKQQYKFRRKFGKKEKTETNIKESHWSKWDR